MAVYDVAAVTSAKELLAEDGVIFISIDGNEQHHLRMLMDEIFGEQNIVEANLTWRSKLGLSNATSKTVPPRYMRISFPYAKSTWKFGQIQGVLPEDTKWIESYKGSRLRRVPRDQGDRRTPSTRQCTIGRDEEDIHW